MEHANLNYPAEGDCSVVNLRDRNLWFLESLMKRGYVKQGSQAVLLKQSLKSDLKTNLK